MQAIVSLEMKTCFDFTRLAYSIRQTSRSRKTLLQRARSGNIFKIEALWENVTTWFRNE